MARTFRELLVDGRLGVYARRGDAVVGHFWAYPSGPRRQHLWGGVGYGPHEVVLAWGRVDPDQRGHGIFKALVSALAAQAREAFDPQRILADVPVDPIASLRAHCAVGFRLYGELAYTKVAGRLVRSDFRRTGPDELARLVAASGR